MMRRFVFPALVATIFLVLFLGTFRYYQSDSELPLAKTTFGSSTDNQSINSFGVLSRLITNSDCEVDRLPLISPSLDKYNVVIWLHQGRTLPQDAAFQRMEDWMQQGGKVIFISNDHNAEINFWREVYKDCPAQDREWARLVLRRAEAAEFYRSESSTPFPQSQPGYTRLQENQKSPWFSVKSAPDHFFGQCHIETGLTKRRSTSDRVTNATAIPAPKDLPAIRVHNYLESSSSRERLIATCKNGSTAIPLIWSNQIMTSQSQPDDLVVVSSGAFLTNFGIVQTKNRPLILRFMQEIPVGSRVAFLESGPGDVAMSTSPESRIVNMWSWMGRKPFPLISLHVLALAVVYCFARYPVFGRPKEVQFKPRNDFGQHLTEVGRLLRSKGQIDFARQKIQHYYDVVKRSLIGKGQKRS